jgi:tetratricopeptide (TPR) repeat protein
MAAEADKPGASAAETIFTAALALSSTARPAYLATACGDDKQLRQRVEALLRAADAPEGFLPETPGTPTGDPFPTGILAASLIEQPGDTIGRYKLREKIGEGGCGIVYLAEQQKPVRRKVALKVIKLGMDTKQVVARFEGERQALALMDHPNIAKVLDAGATETGRPYFVMELVGGIKITDYCDQNELTTRQRLHLFIQVCRAIQHAHQKGIIHRDIKPSNVLVTMQDGVPVPKVIDFGIAKATQGRLTDQTVFTAFEQFIGTPAYMSPEQAQLGRLDVDTRSDIYSLGVLLYELLTGKTPLDSRELLAQGLDAMRRTIQDKEPPTPSMRLKQNLVARQQSKFKIQNSKIEPDLDWVVMKCLEKDRTRRYETANGLATDIERYLKNEPVAARPPNGLYRFQKLVRRNRVVATSAGAIAVVLILGVVASMWQAGKAQREAMRSQEVAKFLTDMLQSVGPSAARGRDTKMLREILDQTAQRVTNDLHNQPDVEAELLGIVGGVYKDLGDDEVAERMFLKALAIRRKDEDPAMAELLAQLCYTQWRQAEKRPQAEANGRQALAIYRKLKARRPGIENSKMAFALDQLAHTLRFQGRRKEAEAAAREALTVVGSDPTPARAYALQVLAMVVLTTEPAMAESLLREAVNIPQASEETENVWRLEILSIAMAAQGRVEEADKVLQKGIASARQSNDLDALVHSLLTLGKLLRQRGNLEAASSTFREDVEMMRKTFGTGYRLYGAVVVELADNLRLQGKPAEAASYYREVLDLPIQEHRSGVNRSVCLQRLVEVLMESNNYSGVDQLFDELKPASVTNSMTALVMRTRGEFFARRSRWEEAAADFTRALDCYPAATHVQFLAAAHLQQGNLEAYRSICQRGIDRYMNGRDPEAAQRIAVTCLVLPPAGTALETLGKMADTAMTCLNASTSAPSLLTKALAEYRRDDFKDAVDWSGRVLACSSGTNSMWMSVQAYSVKAMAQWQLQQTNAAQASLTSSMELADRESSKLLSGDSGTQWLDRIYAHALMREAKAAINSTTTGGPH